MGQGRSAGAMGRAGPGTLRRVALVDGGRRQRREERLAPGAGTREEQLHVPEVALLEPGLARGEVVEEGAQRALVAAEGARVVPAREEPLAPGAEGAGIVRPDLLHVEQAQVARP